MTQLASRSSRDNLRRAGEATIILDERPMIKFKISCGVSVGLNASRSLLSPQNLTAHFPGILTGESDHAPDDRGGKVWIMDWISEESLTD